MPITLPVQSPGMSTQGSLGRLRRARVEEGAVLAVERFGRLIELSVELPWLASTVQPGEFAQLRCGDTAIPLLRRPFSVAWAERDVCSFVFEVVGQGTSLLAGMRPGDTLNVLGPLGIGFSVRAASGPVVCVSGGVGCAPFPLLVRRLLERGIDDIIVINGSSSAARLYPAERFARDSGAIQVMSVTEDGSAGTRGLVTDVLDAALEHRPASLFACGPNPMLAAVAARVGAHPAASRLRCVEASTEAPMGCGFGTCLGCALPVHGGTGTRWMLCCTDGPVFGMDDVAWDEVLRLPGAHVA
jgi:dihydroorotate dehydrogenase electron transfer subunit